MSVVKRYRKKPVEVATMVWDGTTAGTAAVLEWMGLGQFSLDVLWDGGDRLHIHTLEGPMAASPGDVIIRGVQGEHYPCKPDIFEQTYDEVDGEVA